MSRTIDVQYQEVIDYSFKLTLTDEQLAGLAELTSEEDRHDYIHDLIEENISGTDRAEADEHFDFLQREICTNTDSIIALMQEGLSEYKEKQ